jgi:hypothetical protein
VYIQYYLNPDHRLKTFAPPLKLNYALGGATFSYKQLKMIDYDVFPSRRHYYIFF